MLPIHYWIRTRLTELGKSQRTLAVACGVSEAAISRFISGTEVQDPPLSRLRVLSRVLDMPLDEVITRFDDAREIAELL